MGYLDISLLLFGKYLKNFKKNKIKNKTKKKNKSRSVGSHGKFVTLLEIALLFSKRKVIFLEILQ